jgi:hypothetical protein
MPLASNQSSKKSSPNTNPTNPSDISDCRFQFAEFYNPSPSALPDFIFESKTHGRFKVLSKVKDLTNSNWFIKLV